MNKLARVKASSRRAVARVRDDARMANIGGKAGLTVGLALAPHTTMGMRWGPVPVGAVAAAAGIGLELIFAPGFFGTLACSVLQGLGAAEVPGASARIKM